MEREDDWEAEDWEADEWGSGDWDGDDDPDECTMPCPSCGADIYDDAERCPICGDYIVGSHASIWNERPVWWIVLGLLGIAAVIAALAAF